MRKFTFLLITMLFANLIYSQTTIWAEDFSTASTNFTVTLGGEGNDGTADYFQRTDGSNIGITYTGNVDEFFAAQDIDDGGWTGSAAPSELTWTGIDISGYSSLNFEALFASAATAKIDDNDYAIVEINIDGAGWTPLLAFENDGTQYNTYFMEDTDFDGTGDGTQLTSSFSAFTKSIPVTGTTMDIRINLSVNSGGEDIAFDEFKITGVSSTIPTLTWNETTFNEATANDGSISNTISLTLTNETFATVLSQMTEGVDYTVANVPAGLTVAILATTSTDASIALTGNATNHTDADDVLDLTVTFLDAAFTGGDTSAVINSSKNDLFVDFIDGAPAMEMAWDTTYYYEAVANDGSISNLINVTLSNETFATVDTLISGTDYLATNVPAGLDFEIISTSTTTATLALTGNATNHISADDINDLSIAFLDDAFTGGDANAVANSSKTDLNVVFLDPYATDIIITEISYNPPEGGTDSLEFIEIYNNGTSTADLTNFYLGGVTYTFGNVSLNAGEYYVISYNPTIMQNFFGITSDAYTGGLGNGGELVGIYNPNGDIVNAFTYDDSTPWPGAQADGGGHSIVLCDYTSDNSLGENWTISTNYVDTIADGSRVWASPGTSDVICSTNPTMTWSTSVFDESSNNDGTISTIIDLSLTDDEFAKIGTLEEGKDFISANVPTGLSLEITTNSITNASISLTGNAASHTNADDISNLEITFTDTTFVSGFANNIDGYTDTLSVDFIDVTSLETINNSNISVYPNPTKGIVNINGQNINRIEVSNITGKIVLTSNETKFDINKLENGVYFIKVYSNEDVFITRIVLSK